MQIEVVRVRQMMRSNASPFITLQAGGGGAFNQILPPGKVLSWHWGLFRDAGRTVSVVDVEHQWWSSLGCQVEVPRSGTLFANWLSYFFINSSTAKVMALTPVRSVGSGNGANKAECSEGNGLPVCLLSFTLSGSAAPSQKAVVGIV